MSEDDTKNFLCMGADRCNVFRPGKSRSEKNTKIFKRGNKFDGDPAKDSEGKLGRREGL